LSGRFELLIADISDDLKSMDRMKAEYDIFVSDVDWESPSVYEKATVGYYLHNFYNACESIFRSIATAFENQIDSAAWHASVLKRMKLDIPSVRPPVISEELYRLLDDFRAFRHVFRNAYSFELDWAKERLVAEKLDAAAAKLKEEVARFCADLRRE